MIKTNSLFLLCGLLAGCAAQNPRPSPEVAAMKYIGAPYVLESLGEGAGAPYDRNPLRRTDAFDCLTFIETVLADSTGADLQKIRYKDGQIDWFKRNHWTEVDWIPNATAIGLIRPVDTAHSAKTEARVDLQQWYHGKIPSPVGKDSDIIAAAKSFDMSIPYIPRKDLTPELLAEIPDQAVVFFIRCDVDKGSFRGDIIAHAGFLFDGRDLIHAGRDTGVVRIDFLEYMADRKFCGIAVFQII